MTSEAMEVIKMSLDKHITSKNYEIAAHRIKADLDYSMNIPSIDDSIENSQKQLANIRLQRERSIAIRLQSKQDALEMMDSIRSQALKEVKHKQNIFIAKQQNFKINCWKVFKVLDRLRHQRICSTSAELNWKVRLLAKAFNLLQLKIQYHFKKFYKNISILQKKNAWKYFLSCFFNRVHYHFNDMELYLKAYYFRVRRYFKRILLEVALMGRKKRLTNCRMDLYRKQINYNTFLMGLKRILRIKRSHSIALIFNSECISRRKLGVAFTYLYNYTIRMRSKRIVYTEYYWKSLSESLINWKKMTNNIILEDYQNEKALYFHKKYSLDFAFTRWRYMFIKLCHRQISLTKLSKIHCKSLKRNNLLKRRIHILLRKWYSRIRLNKTKRHVRIIRQKRQIEVLRSILQLWKLKIYTRVVHRRSRRKIVLLYILRKGFQMFKNKFNFFKYMRLKICDNYRLRKNKLNKKLLRISLHTWNHNIQIKHHHINKFKRCYISINKNLLVEYFRRWHRSSRLYYNTCKSHYQGKYCILKRGFIKFQKHDLIKMQKKYKLAKRYDIKIKLIKYFQRLIQVFTYKLIVKRKFKKSSLKIHHSEKLSAYKDWKRRYKSLSQFRKYNQLSKMHFKYYRIKKNLLIWMQYISNKYIFRQSRSVRYSLARRMTYLLRWKQAVVAGKNRFEHVKAINNIRRMHLLSLSFKQLLKPLFDIHQENKKIQQYRQSILIPMKLKIFFRYMKLRINKRNIKKKDKRIELYDKKSCKKLLHQWRLYNNKCVTHKEDLVLSNKHYRIVKCLPSFALWKYMFRSFDMQIIANYKAKKSYKSKYLIPKFKLWLNHINSHTMQHVAIYSTRKYFLAKIWSRYKILHNVRKSIHNQTKQDLYRVIQFINKRKLKQHFNYLFKYTNLRKKNQLQKLLAKKKRDQSLKKLTFNGLKTYFIEESLSYRGTKYWMSRACKVVLQVWKDLLYGNTKQLSKKVLSHKDRQQLMKIAFQRRKYISSYFKIKHTTIALNYFRLRLQKKKKFLIKVIEIKNKLNVIYYSRLLILWINWCKELQLSRVQNSIAAYSIDLFRCSRVIPAFKIFLLIIKKQKYGARHHIAFLYNKVLQVWCKYAGIYLNTTTTTITETTTTTKRKKNKDIVPIVFDNWFKDKNHKEHLTINPTLDDVIKVSQQHSAIRYANEMHQYHCIRKYVLHWRGWNKTKFGRVRAKRYAQLHFIAKVMNIFKLNVIKGKSSRAEYRRSNAVYKYLLIRRGYKLIKLNSRLNITTYKVNKITKFKKFKHWKDVYRFVISARKMKSLVQWIQYSQTMKDALYEWKIHTYVENVVMTYLNNICYHRKRSFMDTLISNCISRRRQRAYIIRARRFKTHNVLHEVYASLLLNLEIIYRNKEIFDACYQHYFDYHRRHVLHSLLLLRRNRIAHNYNLRKKFGILLNALRSNRLVVMYCKLEMNKANIMITRKLFHRLYLKAKLNNNKTKQTLRHVAMIGKSIFIKKHSHYHINTTSNNNTTTNNTNNNSSSDRIQILLEWHNAYMYKIYLFRLQQNHMNKRLTRRQSSKCDQYYARSRRYRYFRKLLSYARKRNLKRRNSALLYKYWMNLRIRRAFSKLDMNMAAKWLHIQKLRLMNIHAYQHTLHRIMKAMKTNHKYLQYNNSDIVPKVSHQLGMVEYKDDYEISYLSLLENKNNQ